MVPINDRKVPIERPTSFTKDAQQHFRRFGWTLRHETTIDDTGLAACAVSEHMFSEVPIERQEYAPVTPGHF